MGSRTEQGLIHWRSGPTNAERLCGAILLLEKYESVDPQHPLGGKDGLKDLLCKKDGKNFIAACFFPQTSNSPRQVEKKFIHDLQGATKPGIDGMLFLSNQQIRAAQRKKMAHYAAEKGLTTEIYHIERIKNLLDSVQGYGIRLEFLAIGMTLEEQISFWSHWKGSFEETIRTQGQSFRALQERIDSYIGERLKDLGTVREELAFLIGAIGYIVAVYKEYESAGAEKLSRSYDQFLLHNRDSYLRFKDEYLNFLGASSLTEDQKNARKDHVKSWGHLIDSVCRFLDPKESKDSQGFDALLGSLFRKIDPKAPNAKELAAKEIYDYFHEMIQKIHRPAKKLVLLSALLKQIVKDPDEFIRKLENAEVSTAKNSQEGHPGPTESTS